MENIYTDCGNVIRQGRYVTRTSVERAIKNRVLETENPGSISIMGMQRVGKSSILNCLLFEPRKRLYKEKKIVINASLSRIGSPDAFFHLIASESYKMIKKNGIQEELIWLEEAYGEVLEWNLEEEPNISILCDYLYEVRDIGYKLIVVVDEFDNAIKFFEGHSECFNYMREIAYGADYSVTFVISSRRKLSEITRNSETGVSPFENIFDVQFVKPYNQQELEEYFRIYKEHYGKEFPEKNQKRLKEITGAMPYWMDILMSGYISRYQETGEEASVDEIFDKNAYPIYEQYRRLTELLEDQRLLSPLMQFVFGPIYNAKMEDHISLVEYGILDKQSEVFSRQYYEYLEHRQRDIAFSPLWNQTERELRRIIRDRYQAQYHDRWIEQMESRYRNNNSENDMWDKMEGRLRGLKRDLRRMNVAEDVDILDAMETGMILRIITGDWERFQPVFTKMKKEKFEEISEHIRNARNKFHHSNGHLMSPEFQRQTIDYCRILLDKLENYRKN